MSRRPVLIEPCSRRRPFRKRAFDTSHLGHPPGLPLDLGGSRDRLCHCRAILRDVPAAKSNNHDPNHDCKHDYGAHHDRHSPATATLCPFQYLAQRPVFVHQLQPCIDRADANPTLFPVCVEARTSSFAHQQLLFDHVLHHDLYV